MAWPVGRQAAVGGKGMASYSSRVRQDIARWVEAGLIDRTTADAHRARRRGQRPKVAELRFDPGHHGGAAARRRHSGLRRRELGGDPAACARGSLFAVIFARLCRRRGAEAQRPRRDRRGGLAGRGSGLRRIDRADRPDVSSLRRRDRGDPDLVRRHGGCGGGAALRSADDGARSRLPTAWLFLRGVEFWRVSDFPHAFVAIAARSVADLLLDAKRGVAAPAAAVAHLLRGACWRSNTTSSASRLLLAAISAALFALAVFMPDPVEKSRAAERAAAGPWPDRLPHRRHHDPARTGRARPAAGLCASLRPSRSRESSPRSCLRRPRKPRLALDRLCRLRRRTLPRLRR